MNVSRTPRSESVSAPAIDGQRASIRAVATFEAFKGVVVLVVASGLLLFVHHDVAAIAERIVRHLHLNPASHYPHVFVAAAADLQNVHLMSLAFGALVYALLRFIEAYGLFKEAAWAEWLAVVSGAIYIPFEVMHLVHRFGPWSFGAFVLNVAVVRLMVKALMRRRRAARDR